VRRWPEFCDCVDEVVNVTFAIFPLAILTELDAASFCSGIFMRFAADCDAERPDTVTVATEDLGHVREASEEGKTRGLSLPLIYDKKHGRRSRR
jgi:hypothetical protein